MLGAYTWLKFIHVVSVAVWLGGFAAIGVMNALAGRRAEPRDAGAFVVQSGALGARLVGPASGLAILSGVAGMVVGHTPLQGWTLWGVLAVVLFIAVGAGMMRPALGRIEAAAETGAAPDEIRMLLRRYQWLLGVNALILLSALWAMVFKP